MFTDVASYFGLAYLIATIGVCFWKKKKYVRALILVLLSTFAYQYAAVYATVIIVFLIAIEEKLIWSFRLVYREALATIGCFGMGAINLISIKILQSLKVIEGYNKSTSFGDVFVNIRSAVSTMSDIYATG